MASLQSRLNEFKRTFESGAPAYNAPQETIETMHRATAELKASGIEQQALKIGDPAPSFTLFNQDHVQVSSGDLLREGPLVILLGAPLSNLLTAFVFANFLRKSPLAIDSATARCFDE
jgi:hypothetical protein